MLDSLLSQLLSYVADSLDSIMTWLFGMIDLNIKFFSENFPVVSLLYGIIQGVGIGLAIAIALFQLIKYMTGPLSEVKSHPLEIFVRLGISVALIYFGNYFLETIVNLFSYPHQALINVHNLGGYSNTFGNISGSSGFSTFFCLILIIVVGWNAIKLVLEIIERFVMIGVLTYLSPLAWSAATSRESQPVLFKFLSMFIGQCLLMLLSVWSAKMLLSILGYSSSDVLLSCCVGLAFCKVAQRFDTYLQSMGINAAYTGSSWMDDIYVAGKAMTNIGGGIAKASGNNVLGESLQKGGLIGGLATATSQVGSALNTGLINKYSDGIKISKNKAEGGFEVTDNVSGLTMGAKNRHDANKMANVITGSRAQYEGESHVSRDENGAFHWTDATGAEHQANSLDDMSRIQKDTRNGYDKKAIPRIDPESSVNLNGMAPNNTINNMGSAYAERVLNDDGTIKESAISGDNTLFTKEGADTALTIAAVSNIASGDPQIQPRMSDVCANTITAQNTSTASTLMNLKQANGPITDEKVISATYNKLFDNEISRREINNLAPGLTEAIDNGNVSNLEMNNGEIKGSYMDDAGMSQEYSIISSNIYNTIPEDKQADYHQIQGSDGSTYYANVMEAPSYKTGSSDVEVDDISHDSQRIADRTAREPATGHADIVYGATNDRTLKTPTFETKSHDMSIENPIVGGNNNRSSRNDGDTSPQNGNKRKK